MEKTKPIYMIPATFDWDDIGTWASLERILNADENNNIIFGTPYLFDTENSIIYPEKSNVIALGLKNIIFIKHKNNILIADKKYASELKNHIKKRFNKNN
jgi:mannose-1-phosphate guanylyltransferase